MSNDRLPKRVLFGHMDGTTVGLRGRAQKQRVEYVKRGPAICRALTQVVEMIPGQSSMEGCHKMLLQRI